MQVVHDFVKQNRKLAVTFAHMHTYNRPYSHIDTRRGREKILKIYEDAKVFAVRFDCFQSYLLWSANAGGAK